MPGTTRYPLLVAAMAIPFAGVASAQVDSSWVVVARSENDGCAMVVTGNGQFFRVAASGLDARAPGRYVLTNGDMKPLDWAVRADAAGRFARYYLPFRWHRGGDTVAVSLATPRCRVSAAFDWRRANAAVR